MDLQLGKIILECCGYKVRLWITLVTLAKISAGVIFLPRLTFWIPGLHQVTNTYIFPAANTEVIATVGIMNGSGSQTQICW